MLDRLWELLSTALALETDASDVGVASMALRTVVVYAVAIATVRLANRRFLSRATAFDVIVAIMLGSILSRAINGSASFVPTLLGGGLVLVLMHALFALLAFRSDWFGAFVKGEPILLVRDGTLQSEGMRAARLSNRDLEESLRLQGQVPDVAGVQLAYMERSGQISIVPSSPKPTILEVSVAPGVQTIRIEVR